MYEVKTSLPPKTPYLDLVKSKEGAGEGGGGAVVTETSISVSIPTLLC